jgi:hypothetical protein
MRPGSSSPCSSSHSPTVSSTRGKRAPPFVFPVFFQPQPGDIDRFLSGNQAANYRTVLRFLMGNRRFLYSTRNGVTCHLPQPVPQAPRGWERSRRTEVG